MFRHELRRDAPRGVMAMSMRTGVLLTVDRRLVGRRRLRGVCIEAGVVAEGEHRFRGLVGARGGLGGRRDREDSQSQRRDSVRERLPSPSGPQPSHQAPIYHLGRV